jgi:isopenicillin-N epimerase
MPTRLRRAVPIVPAQADPPKPIRPDIASEWMLDASIDFMNHGSFGARPRVVLEAQARRRAEFEARPIEWLDRRRNGLIEEAKRALGPFLGVAPNDMGFVTNATGGINAVLRSLEIQRGEELLTTNHVYNAVRQTMRHVANRAGATYRELNIPLPVRSADQIIEAIEAALSRTTRILVVDHITSPTALVLPVQRIVESCARRNIDVLIDGAHAPGMLRLNVEAIGAAYYAANLHKWLSAPPGAAFLWVRPDKQAGVHPTTISHFLDEGFAKEFSWQGTRDISPWLCAADAWDYFNCLGWQRVMQHNHQLAVWAQSMLCHRWEVEPVTPVDGSMIGSMVTVLLPRQESLRKGFADHLALRDEFYGKHRLEVPVVDWDGRWWVRPCCQVYNRAEQYERLAEVVLQIVRRIPR